MIGMLRTSSNPGVSVGTMIWLARAWRGASGSVTAMTMAKAAPSADDVNHLCPSMTQASPSRRARVLELGRVGAGVLGLGHGEAAADAAGGERLEPALLLLGGAVPVEDLDVAGVGRLGAEHQVPERRPAQLLADQRVLDQAEAHAAELARHLRAPQTGGPHLVAQALDDRLVAGHAGRQDLGLGRDDVVVDERPHAGAELLGGGGDVEVHRGFSGAGVRCLGRSAIGDEVGFQVVQVIEAKQTELASAPPASR